MRTIAAKSHPVARRAGALLAAMLCAICLALPPCAQAARTVRIYDVAVRDADSQAALQEAMRQALVRITGSRDAAGDPALAALVADAPRFVRQYRPAAGGSTVVTFDGEAVSSAIAAAGRRVWNPARPFTIVMLDPQPTGAAADATRAVLEGVAEARGLPVSLAPLPAAAADGTGLDRETALQSARRLGGDAALVGRSDPSAGDGEWQWTLHTDSSSESWSGPLEAGIHGAVDVLAGAGDATLGLPEMDALVEVDGVTALTDYAAVGRTLDNLPGVSHVDLFEANGATVTFRVRVRGGAQALDRALAGSPRLERTGVANARLVYRYLP